MCKAVVKLSGNGDTIISLNTILHNEPLLLYVDHATAALSLRLCGGQILPLLMMPGLAFDQLAEQTEVTIESFVGGFLTAGYRVGIHSTAH